jgi:hypothetical protein
MSNTNDKTQKPELIEPAPDIAPPAVVEPAPLVIAPAAWEVAQAEASKSLARLQVLQAEVETSGDTLAKEDPDYHYIYVPVAAENEDLVRRRFRAGGWEIVQDAALATSHMWVLRILKTLKQERYQKALAEFNAVVGIINQDHASKNPHAFGANATGVVLTEEQLKNTPRTVLT